METIIKEEKIREENSEVREWTEKNNNEMGNMMDSCYEL